MGIDPAQLSFGLSTIQEDAVNNTRDTLTVTGTTTLQGSVLMTNLPTVDPETEGELFSDIDIITLSHDP